MYCSSSQLSYTHLEDILSALHAGTINLQAGRDLIEIIHENPAQKVQMVKYTLIFTVMCM